MGKIFAVAFDRVPGDQLGQVDYSYNMCKKHGKALGKLHNYHLNINQIKHLAGPMKMFFYGLKRNYQISLMKI